MSDSPAPIRWALMVFKAAALLLAAGLALRAAARLFRESVPLLVVLGVFVAGTAVLVALSSRQDTW